MHKNWYISFIFLSLFLAAQSVNLVSMIDPSNNIELADEDVDTDSEEDNELEDKNEIEDQIFLDLSEETMISKVSSPFHILGEKIYQPNCPEKDNPPPRCIA